MRYNASLLATLETRYEELDQAMARSGRVWVGDAYVAIAELGAIDPEKLLSDAAALDRRARVAEQSKAPDGGRLRRRLALLVQAGRQSLPAKVAERLAKAVASTGVEPGVQPSTAVLSVTAAPAAQASLDGVWTDIVDRADRLRSVRNFEEARGLYQTVLLAASSPWCGGT